MTTPPSAEELASAPEIERAPDRSPSGKTPKGDGPSRPVKVEIEGLQKGSRKLGESPILPILLVGLGGWLAWFATHYWRGVRKDGSIMWPSDPIKSILQGKSLPPHIEAQTVKQAVSEAFPPPGAVKGGGGGTGQFVDGNAIAQDALKYKGHCYTLGGSPGTDGKGCWDCSSFANWVYGHDMRMDIPTYPQGDVYNGTAHGPTVASWLVWTGAVTVVAPKPGDLVLWGPNAHMGIMISPTECISAQDPALGTRVSAVAVTHTGIPVYRRVRAITIGGRPQNTAKLLLSRYGWQGSQFAALNQMWTGESGWHTDARNPNSGALGIAQALGHGGPNTGGSLGNEYGAEYGLTVADARAANSGNALQQIRWGLGYIKAVYGSPDNALRMWLSRKPHWY